MFGMILALLFGLVIPFIRHGSSLGLPFSANGGWTAWPWVTGLLIMAWATLHPASLWLLHRPWMKFAVVAQWVNTRIIMLLLFYLMILPIGLLLRLFGKDAMHRNFDRSADSYRVAADSQENNHMEKPY